MADEIHESAAVLREEERGYGAAAHIFSAIPLWGIVFLIGLWIAFKERSRELVFHIQQAMFFQVTLLIVGFFWLVVEVLAKITSVLNPGMAEVIRGANLFFLVMCYTVYACVCLAGAAMTYMGRPFFYPVYGRRILEGSLTKRDVED